MAQILSESLWLCTCPLRLIEANSGLVIWKEFEPFHPDQRNRVLGLYMQPPVSSGWSRPPRTCYLVINPFHGTGLLLFIGLSMVFAHRWHQAKRACKEHGFLLWKKIKWRPEDVYGVSIVAPVFWNSICQLALEKAMKIWLFSLSYFHQLSFVF